MSFKQALETYFTELEAQKGFTVPETAHYGILATLISVVGSELKSSAKAIVHPSNTGAGIPDLGLFAENQEAGQKPTHGVIEVKPTSDNPNKIAKTEQVKNKYLPHYGQVLVTNFFQFVLVTDNGIEERYEICTNEDEFWKQVVLSKKLASQHADALKEFLLRVLRRNVPLSDPKDIAWILASYAREAKARIEIGGVDLSALDTVKTQLEKALGLTFKSKEGDEFFRSTLVQTLFYGVFSAWVLWHESGKPNDRFDIWRHIRDLNVPVIYEIFHELTHRERMPQGIEEILEWTAQALNRVQDRFFDTFGQGAAIQYFYEPFLEAFDPDLRTQLGVWYTPKEVVQYMVARVDMALREELGIEQGLLDENVYVLDPACGTGAYLVEVLQHIYQKALANEGELLAAQRVREAMVEKRRIFGFELLPAPFVIAHLQIGMLLQQMKAPITDDKRAGIYLTNALTGWDEVKQLPLDLKELQKERDAAQDVKQKQPILVILGNPPYSGYAGLAVDEERDLVEAYRTTKRAPKPQGQGLNDLAVRFFRMAERKITEGTQQGIVCYISNYSWLDGLSHTGMRERYLDMFDTITIDSLNGDKFRTGKTIPKGLPHAGSADPSIFSTPFNQQGIQVGTAISLMVRKQGEKHGANSIHFRNLWGRGKLAQLAKETNDSASIQYKTITPALKLGYPFMPRIMGADYLSWAKLTELFAIYFPGVKTSRDNMVIDIDKKRLVKRLQSYMDVSISHDEMARINDNVMNSRGSFRAIEVRELLQKRGYWGRIIPFYYRPMDVRWLYWEHETKLLDRNRPEYLPHIQQDNMWFASQQKPRREWSRPMTSASMGELATIDRGASYFPLYVYGDEDDDTPKTIEMFPDQKTPEIVKRRPNLSKKAEQYLNKIGADVEGLFYHALAIMHSPQYRLENAGALRQDWPRIPLPKSKIQLDASADLGRQIAALLDVEKAVNGVTNGTVRAELNKIAVVKSVDNQAPSFSLTNWGYLSRGATMPKNGTIHDNEDGSLDIYLNETTYWSNVPREVWDYTLGGYQVLKKWLSYRDAGVLERKLKSEETRDFMHIARRIQAILLLEDALDANYVGVIAATVEL